jgi:hypothetical protein
VPLRSSCPSISSACALHHAGVPGRTSATTSSSHIAALEVDLPVQPP